MLSPFNLSSHIVLNKFQWMPVDLDIYVMEPWGSLHNHLTSTILALSLYVVGLASNETYGCIPPIRSIFVGSTDPLMLIKQI